MQLHPMTAAERPALRDLYRKAFPACERKSWSALERLQKQGRAEILTIDEAGFAGLMITLRGEGLVLLDYFAVSPRRRGGGIGEGALAALRQRCAPLPLCLEIEDCAESGAPNITQRRRRRAFYLRCGMIPTAKMHIYDTDIELLATDSGVTFEGYRALLSRALGGWFTDAHLRPLPQTK